MYVNSLSRILLTGIVTLALTACGGGGGGGGSSLIGDGAGGSSSTSSSSSGGGSSTGTIALAVTDLGEDGVLAGNEVATLTANVTEDGSSASLVVLFSTTIGQLLQESAQSVGGEAVVQIAGDGTAGAATVTATATLSDGSEISSSIVVQTSADGPAIRILAPDGSEASTIELRAAETETVTVELVDWDETPLTSTGVSFQSTALLSDKTSGVTDSTGRLTVTLTGTENQQSGTLTASATFGSFDLEDVINANSLGVNTDDNYLEIGAIDLGTDGVLDGNEKVQVSATVYQDGVAKDGISVVFTASKGTLANPPSATTAGGGIATVRLTGDGVAGVSNVTASATLSNGIAITDTVTVQTTATKPTLDLVVRNQAGASITEFGANQALTLEATIVDHDGTALDAEDAGINVTFTIGTLGSASNLSDLSEFAICPINGIKENADCAYIAMTSNSTAAVGTISAAATINGIALSDSVTVSNTGKNSGSPAQSGFNITRIVDGDASATEDTVSIEGDVYNNRDVTIRADLADIFSNPVPDGTIVTFQTELGDITETCATSDGTCEVIFTSGDPRTPENDEVSFRNLDDDNCPNEIIVDELVTISTGGKGLTDYRVKDILRVNLNATSTVLAEPTNYLQHSYGIECVTCLAGQVMQITYRRLWMDEEDDGSDIHVLLNPGEATEPFLDVVSTPCLADSRARVERITGSVNPTASTSVVGVDTLFDEELAIGDYIRISGEVRQVTSIATNTSLSVSSAFSDNGNDVTPERIAAPAYLGGLGQPYGGRSTILAYAEGEESFTDTNGNGEYDFGEQFVDLPEVIFDKNEDGVLGDVNGDSAVAGTLGPYRDAGLGTDAPGEAREKANPYCYGPRTIIGASDGINDSTEHLTYCFQSGGEEELFIDYDGDGLMNVGNGIYNGSRCLRPLQDADGDGDADDEVCTTDLLNISKQVQILMAGSFARTEFRAVGSNGNGGTNGFGEIIDGIENRSAATFSGTVATPSNWTTITTNAVTPVTLANSLPGLPFGGAEIDTSPLDTNFSTADNEEEVSLFTVSNPFRTANASFVVSFDITGTVGVFDVYAGSTLIINDCGGVPPITCTSVPTTLTSTADLRFVVGNNGGNYRADATISNITVSGTTTGINGDFRSSEALTSNNRTTTALTDFNAGNTINATTVFPGVSERKAASGVVPDVTLAATWANVPNASVASGTFWFTDRFNGQMPDGTVVEISSNNQTGCTLLTVGGQSIDAPDPGIVDGGPHSGTVTVGVGASKFTTFSVTTGGGGSGTITATVTSPNGNQVTDTISCDLLL